MPSEVMMFTVQYAQVQQQDSLSRLHGSENASTGRRNKKSPLGKSG